MNNVIIPISMVLEFDDLGWDDGRDLRLNGKASRSGLPRNHAMEDYEVIQRIIDKTGKSISAAIIVGDWDKDNILRGEVGFTHNPHGWDRASEMDVEKTRKYIEFLESSDIDYMVHGVLHGRYDENGKQINEHEYVLFNRVDGMSVGYLPSAEDMEHRLEVFFKICESWGMKKPFRGFVNPGGLMHSDDELVKEMTKVLYKFGIRYWADPFIMWKPEDGPIKVYNGVACFRWKRNPGPMPWDAYDIDADCFMTVNGPDDQKKSCLHGSHWTNYLRFNPKKNFENVPAWERFYKRQGEVWGTMNGDNLASAVNQTFYYQFAKYTESNGVVNIDLSEVEKNKLDCHKNEFFISIKKEFTPTSCDGGEISLYETHEKFDT